MHLELADLYIKEKLQNSQTLLDIGTGTGEIPIAISEHMGEIVACDFSQEMIYVANSKIKESGVNNISFQIQDCYNLNYSEKMFDVIIASNLLHLLDRPEQFLVSLKRLLKKGGKVIIPTFMHNENMKTRLISKLLSLKGHPIHTRFDSGGMIEFITKCGYHLEKSVLVKSIMPMLFVVVTKKETPIVT